MTSDETDPAAGGACSEDPDPLSTDNPDQEPFQLQITDILDLHTISPNEIGVVVEAYLDEARRKGFATVRIIHGKGIGAQRERVRSVLSRTKFVAHYQDAPGEAGGWGATLVWFNQTGTSGGVSKL